MLLIPGPARYDQPKSAVAVRDRLIAETFDRYSASSTLTSPVSGTLYLMSIPLFAGQVCTSLSFATGTVAATSPTNWWLALYSRTLALLANTADQLTAAIGANTVFTLALTSPYTVPLTDAYYFGLMIAASTPPRVAQQTCLSQVCTFNHVLAGASSSGLTTTPPNPAAAITPGAFGFWGGVS